MERKAAALFASPSKEQESKCGNTMCGCDWGPGARRPVNPMCSRSGMTWSALRNSVIETAGFGVDTEEFELSVWVVTMRERST